MFMFTEKHKPPFRGNQTLFFLHCLFFTHTLGLRSSSLSAAPNSNQAFDAVRKSVLKKVEKGIISAAEAEG